MRPGGHALRTIERHAAWSTRIGKSGGHQAGNRVLCSGPGEVLYALTSATYLRGKHDKEMARAGCLTMHIAARCGGATNRWRSTLDSGAN